MPAGLTVGKNSYKEMSKIYQLLDLILRSSPTVVSLSKNKNSSKRYIVKEAKKKSKRDENSRTARAGLRKFKLY